LTVGKDCSEGEVKSIILHEIIHAATPWDEIHGNSFKAMVVDMALVVFKVEAVGEAGSYHDLDRNIAKQLNDRIKAEVAE
jgi:hypothetical protein